ncbi:helix-turn-helix domain-containing protein [Bizionia hallyeonensis]|uniref:Helix-turn-helix domain-containing protein n=1 Tax=Bizionia hallyeonensis TaxID=1123757 RepID=A0ABW0C7P3_9FLAO
MKELHLNIFNILIISGVVQGFIFSIIVLTHKKYLTTNTGYLAATVLFLSLSNLQYWIIDTNLEAYYPFFKFTYIPWHWLVLPMFYIYVTKFLFQEKAKLKYRMFLIAPFFIVLLIELVYLLTNTTKIGTVKLVSHFERGIYSYLEFASLLFNFIVIYLTYMTIKRFEAKPHEDIIKIKPETSWLKKLIYTGVIICVFWAIGISLVVFFNVNESFVFYPMWLGMSILVYWIGYLGISKSLKLQELLALRKNRENNVANKHTTSKENAFIELERLIKKEQLFLSPNINLHDIATKLALSEGYISQLINKNTDYNFNDYLNKLRVEEIKVLLTNPEYNHYTNVSIGLECGFNSKSSFYSAFKKFTGKTPASFKKEVQNL